MSNPIILIGSKKGGKNHVRSIYSDEVANIFKASGATIQVRRASHIRVSQTKKGNFQGFDADLTPVNGPIIKNLETREAAIAKEREWLTKNNIPFPKPAKKNAGKPKKSK